MTDDTYFPFYRELSRSEKLKKLSPVGIILYFNVLNREIGSHGACTESVTSLAELCHTSPRTLRNEVDKMVKANFLKKEVIKGKGWKLTAVKSTAVKSTAAKSATLPRQNLPNSVAKSATECGEICLQKEKEKNNEKNILKEQGDKSPAFSPFSSLPDGEVKEALMDYVEVRKGSKSPIKTPRQEKLLLNKLEELSGGDTAKKVKIIEAAIMSGWKMFYPLKEDKETRPPARRSDVDLWQGRLIPPQ